MVICNAMRQVVLVHYKRLALQRTVAHRTGEAFWVVGLAHRLQQTFSNPLLAHCTAFQCVLIAVLTEWTSLVLIVLLTLELLFTLGAREAMYMVEVFPGSHHRLCPRKTLIAESAEIHDVSFACGLFVHLLH